MLALAIDSSSDVCTLALGRESGLVAEHRFHHKMDLLRRILTEIDALLSEADFGPGDVDGVIVSAGPGSFTGLRIGMTTAKSLAYSLEKPIVGVGTLDAIALGCASADIGLVCATVFARADEVYWALFEDGGRKRITDYAVSTIDQVVTETAARSKDVIFCGSGARKNAEKVAELAGQNAVLCNKELDYASGKALLDLGMARMQDGDTDDAATLAPLYVRKPTPVLRLEAREKR